MIQLKEINENNWLKALRLTVKEEQKAYVASPIGILARGYVYRDCNARVLAIVNDNDIIGLMMVRDLDEEPACYDLQQFMIAAEFQNKGFGAQALKQILEMLRNEKKYTCVEVCVKKQDAQALHVYEKAGFADTGYIDEDAPDCLNLMYYFK